MSMVLIAGHIARRTAWSCCSATHVAASTPSTYARALATCFAVMWPAQIPEQTRELVRGTQLQPCMRALAVMRAYHAVHRRRVPQSSHPARAAPRRAAMPLPLSLHCLAATGCCPTAAWAAKASQRTKATAQGAALLPRFPQRVFLAWTAQSHGRLPPPWRCVSSASLAIRVGKTGWCCGVAGRVRPGTKLSTQAF